MYLLQIIPYFPNWLLFVIIGLVVLATLLAFGDASGKSPLPSGSFSLPPHYMSSPNLNEDVENNSVLHTVKFETGENREFTFFLDVETRFHVELVRKLLDVGGVCHKMANLEDFLNSMRCHNNYKITLCRVILFTWHELIPEIKKVFIERFSEGVIFVDKNNKPFTDPYFNLVEL